MGEVVNLRDYRKSSSDLNTDIASDGLVPLEFVVGATDLKACFGKLAQYSIDTIHVRSMHDAPNSVIYLIGIQNGIRLNKLIFERENLCEDEIEQRIDLIQMMENMDIDLIASLIESYCNKARMLNWASGPHSLGLSQSSI